jgi:hypothetical protein
MLLEFPTNSNDCNVGAVVAAAVVVEVVDIEKKFVVLDPTFPTTFRPNSNDSNIPTKSIAPMVGRVVFGACCCVQSRIKSFRLK